MTVFKYLVSKGWEGFADRLQCLSQCVDLALKYNRVLCVDWSDRIWTHDHRGFYDYFTFVDLPHVTSVQNIPARLDVFPRFWRGGPGLQTDEWLYKVKDDVACDFEHGIRPEPIWVHSGIGHRTYDFVRLPKHLRLTRQAVEEIQPLIERSPDDAPVVHLRGTDRGGDRDKLKELLSKAPKAAVISDDQTLVDEWMSASPDSVLLTDTTVTGDQAGHKMDHAALTSQGLSKHQMNIRLIADFIILARAPEAHAINEESLFFSMARLFGACNGVAQLFESYPETNPVKEDTRIIDRPISV